MQLVIVSLALFFLILTQDVKAQLRNFSLGKKLGLSKKDTTTYNLTTYEKPDWKTIDVDFLNSYYAQDGNNGAVTGGIGTEQLTDFTQKIILRIPTSEKLSLNLDAGYDYYSSASTDNIDNIPSSDSASDVRAHGNIGLTYDKTDYQQLGFRIGGSVEYDYTSINGGINYSLLSKDKNTSIGLSAQAFIDRWYVIFPRELRGEVSVPTDKRQSYNASIGITRVLNKKMQISLQLEGIYMRGLLSTPFHRVYFQEQARAGIERLPDQRLKLPIGLRLNTHLSEWLVARLYYRYYWDNWGVQGHTANIEVPIKINRFFWIAPYYRYHTQTASTYFKSYKEHTITNKFYTSDHDLANLSSHAFGIGLSYSPSGGIAKINLPFKKRSDFLVKSIDLKYGHYIRSTGLKGNIVSLGVSFSL